MDVISRQAAIDAILHITNCKSVRELFEYNQEHHLTEMWSGGVNDAIDAVIGVESATDNNVGTKDGTNLASLGTDCISRQAAIDTLNEYFSRIGKLKRRGLTKGEKAISLDTVGAINSLPPAEPKRGKWILDRSGAYCCSECMEPCAAYVMMKPRDKFCKMCGSRNEVTT